ncbi:MAG: glycosyltransferase family 39 protein [Candidatus Omnitrophica bacterium]|nr:glycosyltransferase family 39 protein [Candidatus Omnitrophota bacterium]
MPERLQDKPVRYLIGICLAAIFIAAAAVRLYPLIVSSAEKENGVLFFADSKLYATLAYNIYYGKGFSVTATSDKGETNRPFFNRPPGYPFFMASIMSIFERYYPLDVFRVVCIIQGILDAFCCLLVFLLARMFSRRSVVLPLISSALYSLCPYSIYYTRAILVESLTAFLLTMFVLLAVTGISRKQLRWFFYAGLFLGFLILIRPEYLLFVIVFALFLLITHRRDKRFFLRILAVYLAGIMITVLPWSARNYLLSKRPILVSIGVLDSNLYYGTFENRNTWRGYTHVANIDFIDAEEKTEAALLQRTYFDKFNKGDIDEILALEKECKKLALRRIFARPFQTISNWIIKIPNLWYQNNIVMYRGEPGGIFFIFYFIFAVYAFLMTRGPARTLMGLIVTLFIYLTIFFVPLHVEPRFSIPLLPSINCLAGIGIGMFFNKLKNRIWVGHR